MFSSGRSVFPPSSYFHLPPATYFFLFLLTLLIVPPRSRLSSGVPLHPLWPPPRPRPPGGPGQQLALLQYRLSMSSLLCHPQAPPGSGTHHTYQVLYPFNSAPPIWGLLEVKPAAVAPVKATSLWTERLLAAASISLLLHSALISAAEQTDWSWGGFSTLVVVCCLQAVCLWLLG